MKQNTLDLENQDTQAAILTLTHRRVFWRKCQERASYVAGEIRSVWSFFWRCVGWLLLQAAPTLFVIAFVYTCYAVGSPYVAPKPDPLTISGTVEDIIVTQQEIVYRKENGKRKRVFTLIAVYRADTAIVKKWLEDFDYDVREESHIPYEEKRKVDLYNENGQQYGGQPTYLVIHGKGPEFQELRVRPNGGWTVTLDPDHGLPELDSSQHMTITNNMNRFATCLHYCHTP